jgi:hypothetical protein
MIRDAFQWRTLKTMTISITFAILINTIYQAKDITATTLIMKPRVVFTILHFPLTYKLDE